MGLKRLFQRGALPAPLIVAFLTVGACQQADRSADESGSGAADEAGGGPGTDSALPADEVLPAGSATTPGDAAAAIDTPAAEEPSAGTVRGEAGDPEWMQVDAATKTVTMQVVASLTTANSNLNFNGFANGDMTLTVPKGWTVKMTFESRDADLPHSLYVIDEKPPFRGAMPEHPDIPRAYTADLIQGMGPGKKDNLRFPVMKPGTYTMACAVPGHATSGMWDWFVVSNEAERPAASFRS